MKLTIWCDNAALTRKKVVLDFQQDEIKNGEPLFGICRIVFYCKMFTLFFTELPNTYNNDHQLFV